MNLCNLKAKSGQQADFLVEQVILKGRISSVLTK